MPQISWVVIALHWVFMAVGGQQRAGAVCPDWCTHLSSSAFPACYHLTYSRAATLPSKRLMGLTLELRCCLESSLFSHISILPPSLAIWLLCAPLQYLWLTHFSKKCLSEEGFHSHNLASKECHSGAADIWQLARCSPGPQWPQSVLL